MLQEDSNGETFEIIEKKSTEEGAHIVDKALTESGSSIASSVSLLPPSASTGNLFSNVAPPSALPNFVPTIAQNSGPTLVTSLPETSQQPPVSEYYQTHFSAAIPPSKGIQHGTTPLSESLNPIAEPSFVHWMKGAVGASGGIFSKVAEKARNSVESMITTLDPQMREYIYSGGDLDILVASGQDIKISPIQEAFQTVFGKATVRGISVQATNIAAQPVGFKSGIKAAEERIQNIFKNPNVEPMTIVAVENFLLEVEEDKWFDLGVILLNDPIRDITLQTFTQMTPVPSAIVTLAREDTPADYPLRLSGFSNTIGSLMAKNLGVNHTEWHYAHSGVTRREIILSASKTLATIYKAALIPNK